MDYHVNVYVLKGLVKVGVTAKSRAEAADKAIKEVEKAEPGYHGNYPEPDKKYLAVFPENK